MDVAGEKVKRLKDAFIEVDYQDEVQNIRSKIEGLLLDFMEHLQKMLDDSQKVFSTIEPRVKSPARFEEKIQRKDYIRSWDVPTEKREIQLYISKNLPDLIGFRITCFFWKDEKVILGYLKQYYNLEKFGPDIYINFDENQVQENGHEIIKVTGLYKDTYSFELQIKSIMHNLWGEVDHRTQYKKQAYDPSIKTKKDITEELFNILRAADKQLVTLYNDTLSKKQLIYALFFQCTKDVVSAAIKTDVLGKHYENFFDLFSSDKMYDAVQKYVAGNLLSQPYEKIDYELVEYPELSDSAELVSRIKDRFIEYDIRCVYSIFKILFNIGEYEEFLNKMVQIIFAERIYVFEDDMESEGDFMEGSDEGFAESDSRQEDVVKILEGYFKVRK